MCAKMDVHSSNSMPVDRLNPVVGRAGSAAANYSTRKPQRVTITVPYRVYEALVQESDYQGRSMSNLASVWLEKQTLISELCNVNH
jgi:hypothetical protein